MKQRACFDEAQALWAAETASMQERAAKSNQDVEEARQEAKLHQKQVCTCVYLRICVWSE
jgi:hypothetical protein